MNREHSTTICSNFTKFWPNPTPPKASGQKWTFFKLSALCHVTPPPLPPRGLSADVIYGWSLRQMYIDNKAMYAQFCPKLKDFKSCNYGVCPTTTASPNMIDSKYNTMDCQWCPNERPLGKTLSFFTASEGSFKASFTWKGHLTNLSPQKLWRPLGSL